MEDQGPALQAVGTRFRTLRKGTVGHSRVERGLAIPVRQRSARVVVEWTWVCESTAQSAPFCGFRSATRADMGGAGAREAVDDPEGARVTWSHTGRVGHHASAARRNTQGSGDSAVGIQQ